MANKGINENLLKKVISSVRNRATDNKGISSLWSKKEKNLETKKVTPVTPVKTSTNNNQSSSSSSSTVKKPIIIPIEGGGKKTIYPASSEYNAASKGTLRNSGSGEGRIKINQTSDGLKATSNVSSKLDKNPPPQNSTTSGSKESQAKAQDQVIKQFRADQEAKQKAAWLKKSRNSPAAKSGAFSDDERWALQKKHRAWKISKGRAKESDYTITDSYEPYDIVLNHLIETEQAETLEEAHEIMINMDKDIINAIIS